MSSNDKPNYEAPTITVTGYDEFGFPVVVGHSNERQIAIPEPPITPEDTCMVRTVAVPESWLREWQETFSGIGIALKGIGWDSTVDTLIRIGDQIDKVLGSRGGDHA